MTVLSLHCKGNKFGLILCGIFLLMLVRSDFLKSSYACQDTESTYIRARKCGIRNTPVNYSILMPNPLYLWAHASPAAEKIQ